MNLEDVQKVEWEGGYVPGRGDFWVASQIFQPWKTRPVVTAFRHHARLRSALRGIGGEPDQLVVQVLNGVPDSYHGAFYTRWDTTGMQSTRYVALWIAGWRKAKWTLEYEHPSGLIVTTDMELRT